MCAPAAIALATSSGVLMLPIISRDRQPDSFAQLAKCLILWTGSSPASFAAGYGEVQQFFERGGMAPLEVPVDMKLEKAIVELEEEAGLLELLASKSLNFKILRRLNARRLKTARDFALNWCVAKKFRKVRLIPKVHAGDRGAIAEALSLFRGKTVYLYWRRPIEEKLNTSVPNLESDFQEI